MASLAPRPAAFELRSGRLACLWDEELDRFYLWETGDGWSLLNPGAMSLVAGSVSPKADTASSTHTKCGSSWVLPDRRRLRGGALVQPLGRASSRTEDGRQPGARTRSSRVDQQEPHSMLRSRRV
jgi:hypothetical protein